MWPLPLFLALAVAVMFHSARAMFQGLHYFGVLAWRTLTGAVFNGALSVILYLQATEQWSPPMLDLGLGLM